MSELVWKDGWPWHRKENPGGHVPASMEDSMTRLDAWLTRYTDREVDALLAERWEGWERTGHHSDAVFWGPGRSTTRGAPSYQHDIAAAMRLFCAVYPDLEVNYAEANLTDGGDSIGSFPHTNTPESIAAAIRLAALRALELQEVSRG